MGGGRGRQTERGGWEGVINQKLRRVRLISITSVTSGLHNWP